VSLLYVAIGGACGSVLRFVLQNSLNNNFLHFPFGTFSANIIGSLIAGFLLPLTSMFPDWLRPLLVVGFLGGFTTMSSYTAEVSTLIVEKRFNEAAFYWAATSILSLLCCVLGAYLVSIIIKTN